MAFVLAFASVSCSNGSDSVPSAFVPTNPTEPTNGGTGGDNGSGGGSTTNPTNPTNPTTPDNGEENGGQQSGGETSDPISNAINATTANIVQIINDLTEDAKLVVTGEGSEDLIMQIGAALKQKSEINVDLDLSAVTGVTELGKSAFEGSNLVSIELPNTLTKINLYAFKNCAKLGSIAIPDSVTKILSNTFEGCSNLTNVVLSNGLSELGSYLFKNCTKLVSLTIPDNIIKFSIGVFSGCSSLTSLTIPNSVTSIGAYLFYNCENLKSVTISNSVTSSPTQLFTNCKNLENISIPNCDFLATVPKDNKIEKIIISGNPTIVGGFKGYTHLREVQLPDSVTEIAEEAFCGCSNLCFFENPFKFPRNLKKIGKAAFHSCGWFCLQTLPDGLTEIGEKAFYESGLLGRNGGELIIPNSVTKIGQWAFGAIRRLTYEYDQNSIFKPSVIVISENSELTEIAEEAFKNCIISEIVIPKKNKKIGKGWFKNCTLKNTNVTIPSYVTEIEEGAFYNCNITEVFLSNTITSIGQDAFYGCEFSSFSIPSSISEINFLGGCKKLTNITIPTTVTKIGNKAFCESGITNVVIPNSVEKIGDQAFYLCSSLTNINIADTVTYIGQNAFYGCNITSISIPFGVTEIKGLCCKCKNLKNVTLPDSLIKIGEYSFQYCESLESITIPKNVNFIGYEAFYGCNNLKSLTFKNKTKWHKLDVATYCDQTIDANTIKNAPYLSLGSAASDAAKYMREDNTNEFYREIE